jgi:homoaconitate hydratase
MGDVSAQGWLASPRSVAEAALSGEVLVGPVRIEATLEPGPLAAAVPTDRHLVEGFPERLEGRAVFVAADDLDTDQIYPSTAVYREVDPAEMGSLLLRNHDPDFAETLAGATILVGGFRFGCGSSREQAATAIEHAGIRLVITGSMARSFRRNAANLGLLCVEAPDFVEHLKRSPGAAPTVALDGPVAVDFREAVIRYAGREFSFDRPPALLQELHVDGGVPGRMRRRFAQGEGKP